MPPFHLVSVLAASLSLRPRRSIQFSLRVRLAWFPPVSLGLLSSFRLIRIWFALRRTRDAPKPRCYTVHRIRSTLVLLTPSPWRAQFIRETVFSVSFGLSLNPVLWGELKVLSSIVATGGADGFFLLALLALLLWIIFHPSGEAAMEAKGFRVLEIC